VIFLNLIYYMQILVKQSELYDYQIKDENLGFKELIKGIQVEQQNSEGTAFTPEVARAITALCADPAISDKTMGKYADFQISDSAQYFFDKIGTIAAPGYLPDEKDMLRVRIRTTGVAEVQFEISKIVFKVIDVGGQRIERKKWIHCFDEVSSVVFVVAMSEYDLTLEEAKENRMKESLKLAGEITGNVWFVKTPVVLLLNKKDLFEEKIKRVDLSICFPEYTGGSDFTKASKFIEEQYKSKIKIHNDKRPIFCHVTCATDTTNIKTVFTAMKSVLLDGILINNGLLN